MQGLTLTFAQTVDDKGTIATRTYGKCHEQSKLPDPPTIFEPSEQWQSRKIKLCESAPWFRWNITIKTAGAVGSGTDADIQARLACGGTPVTGQLALVCPSVLSSCFERWVPGKRACNSKALLRHGGRMPADAAAGQPRMVQPIGSLQRTTAAMLAPSR